MGEKNVFQSFADDLKKKAEAYLVPVKLQQMYKGYTLRDVTLAESRIPVDFLITLATLADRIYLTGTRAYHSPDDTAFGISLKTEMGVLFQNHFELFRFDAATGMVFETMGPFGALVATAVPSGLERLPTKGRAAGAVRYRLFIVFRGTNFQEATHSGYLDDLSTDAKATAFKVASPIGNKVGELSRGFAHTYASCRTHLLDQLLPRGFEYLAAKHRELTGQKGARKSSPFNRADVELYVVGHSLGGAVATLCAYDLACRFPRYLPVLVTFGSPPVGNIDFAIDFQKVMVDRVARHPRTGYLRSVRVVATTAEGHHDFVTSWPEKLPNYIHVNTRLVLSNQTAATTRFGAHSMTNSYIPSLKGSK